MRIAQGKRVRIADERNPGKCAPKFSSPVGATDPWHNRCYPTAMQITVELPDDMARQMIPAGRDPARAALEDMAVEAYRAHRLTEHELASLLGMDRYQLDGFLKKREVWLEYTMDDLRKELEAQKKLGF